MTISSQEYAGKHPVGLTDETAMAILRELFPHQVVMGDVGPSCGCADQNPIDLPTELVKQELTDALNAIEWRLIRPGLEAVRQEIP